MLCWFSGSKMTLSKFTHVQQYVSNIAHFVKGSLITSFLIMTNRKWVTLHVLWKAVSSHLFWLWPTASEWHCTFCERQSHHIFSYDQQEVSDIAHIVKGSCITCFPIQQRVSYIRHFVRSSFTSLLMTNRKWVTLHRGSFITSFLTTNLTGSKWHCTFCERQSHQILSYDQQEVSDIAHFVKGSLIRSYLMTWTNRKWVTLHILWKAVSSDLLWLGPTGSEWHCTFCEQQSHHIIS